MPYETPDEIAAGEICYQIVLPDDDFIISCLMEALTDLGRPRTWVKVGAVEVNTIADIFMKAAGDMSVTECDNVDYQRTAFIPGNLAQKIAGAGTLSSEYLSTAVLSQRTGIASPAVGTQWQYQFTLAAGRYEFRAVIQRLNSANGCIVDWYLDGDLIVDNMSWLGSSINTQINNTVDVLTDGGHVLMAQVASITGTAQTPWIHYLHFVPNVAPA